MNDVPNPYAPSSQQKEDRDHESQTELDRDRYRKFYETANAILYRIGALVVLLLVLRPRWGHVPADFYLGHPVRFYITQDDVANSYVSVTWFLWDLLVWSIPVYGLLFVLIQGLRSFRGRS